MTRRTFILSAVPIASLALLTTLESPLDRADLSYVNPSGIHTLDPVRMSWTQDFRIALNLWEGLTTWHPQTTEPIEGAAEFPPEVSADGLTYTFTIDPRARWSNGDPVTSHDFLRGWRRGMEPGSATDYTFLFSDHIVGAAQYVRWRRRAVGALTALKRLADGWGIEAAQGETLVRHPVFEQIREASELAPEPPIETDDHRAWANFADSLANLEVNWNALYEAAFEAHVAEFQGKFRQVGVEAVDDRTLVVQLTQPCPYFLDLVAFPIFLPCHESIELHRLSYRDAPITAEGLVVYDPQWTKPDADRNGYPGLITNGPYRLAEWTFKRRLRMVANPYYRQFDAITCRSVDMLVYENINAAIMAYEAGDVDFLPAMDVSYDHEIARLARTGERPDFHLCHVLGTYFFNFNCATKMVNGRANPFVDPLVRKAFVLSVDRKQIVDKVLKRGDRVAYSFVPPKSIPGYEPPAGTSKNIALARQLLTDAGFPGGKGLPGIELLYTSNDERTCQAIARMWEDALGVRIELRSKEPKTFAEDKANQRFMIARGNWFADYNDPTTFLDCLTTGNGNNDSGYQNPKYDRLLAQANSASDSTRRADLLRQAEAIIVQVDNPILPILHYATPIAIKPYVKGLYPNARLWFPFRGVRVER